MRSWNKSLMARLVGYFLLLSLVMVSLVVAIAFSQARQSLKESVFTRLDAVATLKEDELNRWIDDQRRDVVFIAWLPEIGRHAGILLSYASTAPEYQDAYTVLTDYLKFLVTSTSDSAELFILNLDGEVILSTDKSHEHTFLADTSFFLHGLSKLTQSIDTAPDTGQPQVTIATPLFDNNKRRIGVLASYLNLSRIDRLILERTGLETSGEAYLVSKSNSLVSAEPLLVEGEYSTRVHSVGIDSALSNEGGQGLYLNYAGIPVIGVYRWLEDRDMALLVEMSQAEAFAPARELAGTIILFGILSASLLALGVYLLARQIAYPILAITNAATRVEAGDLTQKAPILTEDEVGVLASTFNQMTEKLRVLYEHLEEQVSERTSTLSQVNKHLEQEIIEREKVERDLRRYNEYLAAWYATTTDVSAELELSKLLHAVVERAAMLLRADTGELAIFDPEKKELQIVVSYNLEKDFTGTFLALGEGAMGKALLTQQPVIIDDYSTWEGKSKKYDACDIHSSITAPLMVSGRVVGAISMSDRSQMRKFTEDDVNVLTLFTSQAAIAMENARLFTSAQEARKVAESANRAKSTFLANTSHELRTPLNAIIGYSEMLIEECESKGIKDLIPDLQKIRTSGKQLLALINDILDLSKIEAGRMELYLETFDVSNLIGDVIATVLPTLEKNANILEVQHTENLGTMYADVTKVRQVLYNLLSNAAKFTDHGKIYLEVERLNQDHADWYIFKVSDTGIGMNKDQISKLFQAFSQADISTTRKYGGTGLGLAITKVFLQMMGGSITVESELGAGSTFIVQIPANVSDHKQDSMDTLIGRGN